MKMPQNTTKKVPLKEKQKSFIEAYIKHMGNISQACEDVGVDRSTYYRWMKKPRFKIIFNMALEQHNDLIFQRILNLALKEDKDMLKFWAKTQMRHRGFVEKQEIEQVGGEVKIDVKISDEIKKLFEEQA